MQQPGLFDSKPPPSGEGEYCVAVKDGQRWFSISRDHRWVEPGSANEWAKAHPYELMGRQWRVVLVEEFGKA